MTEQLAQLTMTTASSLTAEQYRSQHLQHPTHDMTHICALALCVFQVVTALLTKASLESSNVCQDAGVKGQDQVRACQVYEERAEHRQSK